MYVIGLFLFITLILVATTANNARNFEANRGTACGSNALICPLLHCHNSVTVAGLQCDQMTILFFQRFAIYNNEKLPR